MVWILDKLSLLAFIMFMNLRKQTQVACAIIEVLVILLEEKVKSLLTLHCGSTCLWLTSYLIYLSSAKNDSTISCSDEEVSLRKFIAVDVAADWQRWLTDERRRIIEKPLIKS